MKVIYFGTSSFAVPALRAIAEHVVLVISQPDRPSGRKMQINPSPVSLAAQELNLPLETPEKSRKREFIDRIESVGADLMLVASYGQILPERLLAATYRGAFNLHGSILPSYRGAAPIQRAVMNGDQETGVTLMQMAKGMDTGDIIDIARTQIYTGETYGALHDRLAELAAAQIMTWLPSLYRGQYPRTPQDHELATYADKISRDDQELRFEETAESAWNRFRGVTPSPGAFLNTQFGNLKIRDCVPSRVGDSLPAGTVLSVNPLIVTMASGALELRLVQPEGKRAMSGSDFCNGFRIKPGNSLLFQVA